MRQSRLELKTNHLCQTEFKSTIYRSLYIIIRQTAAITNIYNNISLHDFDYSAQIKMSVMSHYISDHVNKTIDTQVMILSLAFSSFSLVFQRFQCFSFQATPQQLSLQNGMFVSQRTTVLQGQSDTFL